MRKVFAFKITTFCILMACLLQSCGYILPDPILRERKRDQIGKYVIDMERTEWGDYEEKKDNYSDLSIVFKKDNELSHIHFSSQIQKRGITRNGTWLWECWEVAPGDSVTAIIGPIPQHNEQRQIPKLYFRKVGHI